MLNLPAPLTTTAPEKLKSPSLVELGQRVTRLRAARGMTRKAVANAADISERHLANLEYGLGNASYLVLESVAQALNCPLAELIGDITTSTPEWLMLREVLSKSDDEALRRVRLSLTDLVASKQPAETKKSSCIALVGLRGAGKTTLGQMLANDLNFPFIEMSRNIEKLAGCNISEIQALYGMNAYRRYEKRALDECIAQYPHAVVATPGGVVSDAATFNTMLSQCTTVWLQADPLDHMHRVQSQGDLRPMAASKEAMDDLKQILAGRSAFYSKSDLQLNTSAQPLEETFAKLRHMVRDALSAY